MLKRYFNVVCILLIVILCLNIFWYLLEVLYVNLPVKPPNFGPKGHFFHSSLVWWPFSVTIATVKVRSILNQNT